VVSGAKLVEGQFPKEEPNPKVQKAPISFLTDFGMNLTDLSKRFLGESPEFAGNDHSRFSKKTGLRRGASVNGWRLNIA